MMFGLFSAWSRAHVQRRNRHAGTNVVLDVNVLILLISLILLLYFNSLL
jgi:hypothetical protein